MFLFYCVPLIPHIWYICAYIYPWTCILHTNTYTHTHNTRMWINRLRFPRIMCCGIGIYIYICTIHLSKMFGCRCLLTCSDFLIFLLTHVLYDIEAFAGNWIEFHTRLEVIYLFPFIEHVFIANITHLSEWVAMLALSCIG